MSGLRKDEPACIRNIYTVILAGFNKCPVINLKQDGSEKNKKLLKGIHIL
jgi:hypothetical protein